MFIQLTKFSVHDKDGDVISSIYVNMDNVESFDWDKDISATEIFCDSGLIHVYENPTEIMELIEEASK